MSDKPPAYEEDGNLVFRASSVAMSPRAMVLALMGYETAPISDKLQSVFDDGHRLEPVLVEVAEHETGLTFDTEQVEVELEPAPGIIIRGHLDGISDSHGLECKALGQSLYGQMSRGKMIRTYADQLTVYMEATGKPFHYICGLKSAKEGADDVVTLADHFIKEYTTPPSDIKVITDRVTEAVYNWEEGILPSECDCDGFCPYWHMHEVANVKDLTEDFALDQMLAQYHVAHKNEQKYKAEKAQLKDKIRARMGEEDRVETNRYRVTWVEQTRSRLDTQALSQVVDLADYQTSYEVAYPKVTDKEQT